MSSPDKKTEFQDNLHTTAEAPSFYGFNELELYKELIEESPVATCLWIGRDLRVAIINNEMLNFWGKDRSITGMPLAKALPELEGQPYLKILDNIFETGETYSDTSAPAVLYTRGVLDTYYFDFTYKPLLDQNGKVYAIMNKAIDVTERVKNKLRHEASENRFRLITEQSPMAIGLLKGRDMIIEVGNEKILQLWGKDASVTGLPLIEALPELKGQAFLEILQNVYDTGETFYGYDMLAKLEYKGDLLDLYFDFTYTAVRDENGTIDGVMVLANEVTQRVVAAKKIAASEAKFRALMQAAPAAMGLFVGRDLVVEMPNRAFIDIVGKGDDIEGKPLKDVMPELENQAFLQILDDVYTSGKQFQTYGTQVNIVRNGVMTYDYYNITYTPVFNEDGQVYAILDIAIPVTEFIQAKKAVEEAEAILRGAVELAELGTWSLNVETNMVSYSQRMLEWYGFTGDDEILADVYKIIHPDDRTRIQKAILNALEPESDGMYDEEYTVINRLNGRERILHAQGKVLFNSEGKAYLITGTAQDITTQRKIQTALQNQVTERTQQLELANKGLEEANRQLLASNEELAQYAYVASHDLQEPLRKITMFSNLLTERDTDKTHTQLIEKIVKSSKRMSSLIKDLLEFSRLLNTDVRFTETDLTTVVKAVRDDFELLVEEKNANIVVENLPVLQAVPLQMNQLFYNLIGNALKFVPQGRKPEITITCEIANMTQIMAHIAHPSENEYYIISVQDNGIGIDEQYIKQIFDVFKRLHGRDEYTGSGIGLAICRRIVTNHNGGIYVDSKPGEGTTFRILLPKQQA